MNVALSVENARTDAKVSKPTLLAELSNKSE
jgi:hypothetical protein